MWVVWSNFWIHTPVTWSSSLVFPFDGWGFFESQVTLLLNSCLLLLDRTCVMLSPYVSTVSSPLLVVPVPNFLLSVLPSIQPKCSPTQTRLRTYFSSSAGPPGRSVLRESVVLVVIGCSVSSVLVKNVTRSVTRFTNVSVTRESRNCYTCVPFIPIG